MNIFHIDKLDEIAPFKEPIAVTIGVFDGLHLGHQALLSEVARYSGSTVITFKTNTKTDKYLLDPKLKCEIVSRFSIENYVVVDLNAIKETPPQDFIVFLQRIKTKTLVLGADFRFGYQRMGDIALLERHFTVLTIPYVRNGGIIRSKAIRGLLDAGDITRANEYLGRHYSISGIVVSGAKLGHKIGFPTANIAYENTYLPKNGVYVGYVLYNDVKHVSLIYVGRKPTVNTTSERFVEVYITDFSASIYGEHLNVGFLEYIREDIKFPSIDELKKQLALDLQRGIFIYNLLLAKNKV